MRYVMYAFVSAVLLSIVLLLYSYRDGELLSPEIFSSLAISILLSIFSIPFIFISELLRPNNYNVILFPLPFLLFFSTLILFTAYSGSLTEYSYGRALFMRGTITELGALHYGTALFVVGLVVFAAKAVVFNRRRASADAGKSL